LYATNGIFRIWNTSNSDRIVISATGFAPAVDNGIASGSPGQRWTAVYAVAGSINTSDAREKDWRGGLSDDELAAASDLTREIGVYRWLYAIEDKGENARLHVGVLAQQVREVMERHNLDATRYGFFCFDEWGKTSHTDPDGKEMVTPAGDRYSVRYDELTLFMLAAQEQRLAKLENTMYGDK
jgi:hypothetical protein